MGPDPLVVQTPVGAAPAGLPEEVGGVGLPATGAALVTPDGAAEPTVAGALTPERARTSASVRLDPQPAVASIRTTAAAPSGDRRIESICGPPKPVCRPPGR